MTDPLSVVLAGADKESDLIPTFKELSSLFPDQKLKLTLVGPMVSKSVAGIAHSDSNLQISRYSGLVQDICEPSDLVICMNAGLSAYSTWKDAVLVFSKQKITCFITDFCLLSVDSSRQAIDYLRSSGKTEECKLRLGNPIVNPFRSPFRKRCDTSKLHRYSNAFICQLFYE